MQKKKKRKRISEQHTVFLKITFDFLNVLYQLLRTPSFGVLKLHVLLFCYDIICTWRERPVKIGGFLHHAFYRISVVLDSCFLVLPIVHALWALTGKLVELCKCYKNARGAAKQSWRASVQWGKVSLLRCSLGASLIALKRSARRIRHAAFYVSRLCLVRCELSDSIRSVQRQIWGNTQLEPQKNRASMSKL